MILFRSEFVQPMEQIQKIFEKYTTSYHFYLRDLRSGKEFELGQKKRYPICSCFKLAVLMAFFDSLNDETELEEEITLDPKDFSVGGGILNHFTTPVKFTYFQLAQMMMTFSDSTSTDYLIARLGSRKINTILERYCDDSKSELSLNEMISSFQKKINTGKERYHSLFEAGNYLIERNSYTNAKDLANLSYASYSYKSEKNLTNQYLNILRSKKHTPRTDLFFNSSIKFIGKTGSIGFGFYTHDCGVIESEGHPIAVLGYTSEGWNIVRELVELHTARVGLYTQIHLGFTDTNERWTIESEHFLEK